MNFGGYCCLGLWVVRGWCFSGGGGGLGKGKVEDVGDGGAVGKGLLMGGNGGGMKGGDGCWEEGGVWDGRVDVMVDVALKGADTECWERGERRGEEMEWRWRWRWRGVVGEGDVGCVSMGGGSWRCGFQSWTDGCM